MTDAESRARTPVASDQVPLTPNLAPRQFAKNLIVSVASLLTALLTGFFLTPFLIRNLGVSGYGLVPLILGVVNYLSVAGVTLNAAAARNVSIAMTRGKHEEASRIFNTALCGSAALAGVLLVLGIGASSMATRIIHVPPGLETDAHVLFLIATVTTILTLLSTPLSVPMFYANRLDRKSTIDLGNRLLYAVAAALLVAYVARRPSMVGVALLGSSALGIAQVIAFAHRHAPALRPRLQFDLRAFRQLVWFGGWTAVLYLGNLVFLTMDIIIVNRTAGPHEGGIYAALMQWPLMIRGLGTAVGTVFTQPMAHIYAKSGMEGLFRHAARSVRIMGSLIALGVATIAGSAEPLLRLWLGESFSGYWPLLVLLTIHLGFNLATLPYLTALQAALRVRAIGLVTCAAGLADIVLAIVLVKTTMGIYGVAAAGAIAFTVLSAAFVPLRTAAVFTAPKWQVMKPVAAVAVVTITVALLGHSWARHVSGWASLAAVGALNAAAAGALCVLLVIDAEERQLLRATLRTLWTGAMT